MQGQGESRKGQQPRAAGKERACTILIKMLQIFVMNILVAVVLLLAPQATSVTSVMNVTNSVVFPGNKHAKGATCQSWW